MKRTKMKFMRRALLGLALLALASCNQKEEDQQSPVPASIGETEAVQIIEESFKKDLGGSAKDMDLLSTTLAQPLLGQPGPPPPGILANLECGVAFDTTHTFYLSGSATGSFTHTWNLLLNCAGDLPVSLDVNAEFEGEYDGPNQDRWAEGNRNWVWTGLNPSLENFILNGTSSRNGQRTYNVGNQNTFTWWMEKQAIDLSISKATHEITDGLVLISGELGVSNGNSYSFEASVAFNGNGTATVTINGNTYIINL